MMTRSPTPTPAPTLTHTPAARARRGPQKEPASSAAVDVRETDRRYPPWGLFTE
jgi:hypothetical protein